MDRIKPYLAYFPLTIEKNVNSVRISCEKIGPLWEKTASFRWTGSGVYKRPMMLHSEPII